MGSGHPYVADAERLLAYLLLDRGEPERARPLLAHALSVREQTTGLDSGQAAEVFLGLGRAHLAGGNSGQAIAAFERALVAFDKDPGSTWVRAEAQLGLAIALWQSGKDTHRARRLAADARRYFQAHDPSGRFLASTGAFEAAEAIR